MLSMGTSTITPCYDAECLETKTQVGLDPGESIEYTKHRLSLEGHLWPGCHPVSDTWRPYINGQTKQRNNVGQVNPEDCYPGRDSWVPVMGESAGSAVTWALNGVKSTLCT